MVSVDFNDQSTRVLKITPIDDQDTIWRKKWNKKIRIKFPQEIIILFII